MKLYTEEQVIRQKKALQEVIDLWNCGLPLDLSTLRKCENALLQLTPIKLPSDEEIVAAALDTYREHPNNPKEHPEWTYNKDVNAPRKRRAFNIGAHWVLNHINQQKDIDVPLSKQQNK
jgi:hypothetical protein